jgi:hypothetical protein
MNSSRTVGDLGIRSPSVHCRPHNNSTDSEVSTAILLTDKHSNTLYCWQRAGNDSCTGRPETPGTAASWYQSDAGTRLNVRTHSSVVTFRLQQIEQRAESFPTKSGRILSLA